MFGLFFIVLLVIEIIAKFGGFDNLLCVKELCNLESQESMK